MLVNSEHSASSSYAQWLAESLAKAIFADVESHNASDPKTHAGASCDYEADREGNVYSTYIYCGDEAASKLEILPEYIREELDQAWRREFRECVSAFAENWNESNPGRNLRLTWFLTGEDFPNLAGMDEDISDELAEWQRNWFSDEQRFMIGMRCIHAADTGIDVEIVFNNKCYDFPETHDSMLYQRKLAIQELREPSNIDSLAVEIKEECIALYANEKDYLAPAM